MTNTKKRRHEHKARGMANARQARRPVAAADRFPPMIASNLARRRGGHPFKGMPARMIWNPASGGGSRDPEEVLANLEYLDTVVTERRGDAREAARAWPEELLVVAGGDGTAGEAVNGPAETGFGGAILALPPTGTGNDLARTLAVPRTRGARWLSCGVAP